ncbi:MAG: glycerate kinase [Microbacteriaceae bacterium]|nr:MAG: glycerate kinase [Microbacteriaceae bacterium]
MRVVVAPDSFTGSCSARDAALAIAAGWRSVRPDDEVLVLPQADGGVGTLEVVAAAVPDAALRDAGEVTGADGRPAPGRWLELPDGRALVELADCVGLWRMERPDPLGARFLDAEGRALPDGGAALARLDRVDLAGLRTPPAELELWCDVDAPLTGPRGAASVFGPQKGADAEQVRELDAALARLAGVLGGDRDSPGAGAAGGTAYGLVTAWGAHMVSGSAAVSALTGLDDAIPAADLVVTGEGRVDAATAAGKVAGAILRRAEDAGVPVALVAGAIDSGAASGIPAASLVELAGTAEAAMTEATRWIERAGAALAERLAPGPNVSRVPSV